MSGVLTDPQREVLTLKANGLTTMQITRKLKTTRATVDGLMTHVFNRLGVSNCPQAVAIGLKLEELDMNRIEMTVTGPQE
jgi:DNA-binding CsgD family transcriptional regulator